MVAIPACLVGLGEGFRYFPCVYPHHHSYIHQQVMGNAFTWPDVQTTPKMGILTCCLCSLSTEIYPSTADNGVAHK